MKKFTAILLFCAGTSALPVLANSPDTSAEQPNWADNQHKTIRTTLHNWSNEINSWLGTPDPDKPASASLRVMLDQEWNRYDGYSFKPRVRGKIKLPVLKDHLNLVFGDERLDEERLETNRLTRNYQDLEKDKHHNAKEARQDNSSVALRWTDDIKSLGIDTDFDIGIRSGDDLYLRFRAIKAWQPRDNVNIQLEQLYRYGIDSKHYLRTNLESKWYETDTRLIGNNIHFVYANRNKEEERYWGSSFYRQHNYAGSKQLNYGLFIGGEIDNKTPHLDVYGPFVNWRQPILRKWLFIQPEVHYYNDKKADRNHHIGAFLRLEALF